MNVVCEIWCYRLVDGSTIIGKKFIGEEVPGGLENPCDLRLQAMQGQGGVNVQPVFTPVNQFGLQRFPAMMAAPKAEHVMFSYLASPEMANAYEDVIQQLAARAAGIVPPNSEAGRAVIAGAGRGRR